MKGNLDMHKKDNSIKKLEQDLYDPKKDHGQRRRRKIHGRNIELEHDFQNDEYERLINGRRKYKLPTSIFKKFFFVVFTFFVITAVIAGITLREEKTTVSGDLIALDILAQPFVDGGEALELQVRVQNFNEQDLELPDLIISYPKDSSPDAEQVFQRRALDNLGNQGRAIEEFDLVLFGQEGDLRDITATLEYRIEGSSAIFVEESEHQVLIRSTPTELTLEAPDTIIRGQEFSFAIDVSANSSLQVNNTLLNVRYPRGFEFIRSNVSPDFSNHVWELDAIGRDTQRIEIFGRLAALEGQGQSFAVRYGKQDPLNRNNIETVFNALTHTIEVQRAFINTSIVVNGRRGDKTTIRGGDKIQVDLEYENTLTEALENVVLTLHLDGNLYDDTDVNTLNGFYNSSNKTITFDQTTTDRLQLLQPGEKGSFSVTLGGRKLVGSTGVLSAPSLELVADIQAVRGNGQSEKAISTSRHLVAANSDISVIPQALHYEGPFKNDGSMPPRVGDATTYTLSFQVTNSSNDLKDAKLTTFLPPYVEWMNTIAPSVERTRISYDPTTRQVLWQIGELRAGTGVGSQQPRELSVQVRLTPSIQQVGTKVDLTRDIVLEGTDVFTDADLSFRKTPLDNRLQNRAAIGADGRIVE